MTNKKVHDAYLEKYPNKFLIGSDSYTEFVVEVVKQTEYVVDFHVYDGIKWAFGDDEPFEMDLYLTCSIKWDGCSHFWFGEMEDGKQDGYLHICGLESYYDHVRVMKFLYNKAFEIMGREPLDHAYFEWSDVIEQEEETKGEEA